MKTTPIHALIVDDDPTQNQILTVILKKLEITAHVSTSVDEFFKQLETIRASFCLVDINIGELSAGYGIVEKVRQLRGNNFPIIVISSNSAKDAIVHAMELGASDYMIKPVEKSLLATKLSLLLREKELPEARPVLLPVPPIGVPASIEFKLSARKVDEFGITVTTPHMLCKGSEVFLSGALAREISRCTLPLKLTTLNSWFDADQAGYCSFLEFDPSDKELLCNVRDWISAQEAKKNA